MVCPVSAVEIWIPNMSGDLVVMTVTKPTLTLASPRPGGGRASQHEAKAPLKARHQQRTMAARVSSPRVRLLGEKPEPVVWSQIRYDQQFDRGGINSLYYPPLLHYHSAEWNSPFMRRVASEPAIKQRPQTSPWEFRRGRSREFLSSPPASVPHSFLECAHVAPQFSEPKSCLMWHLIAKTEHDIERGVKPPLCPPPAIILKHATPTRRSSLKVHMPSTVKFNMPSTLSSRTRYFTGLEKPSPAPLRSRLALAERLTCDSARAMPRGVMTTSRIL